MSEPQGSTYRRQFRVQTTGATSVDYIYDFAKTGRVKWGIGGLVGFIEAPSQLDPHYGSSPRSYMVFLQGRL